jgi:hypothetical protein
MILMWLLASERARRWISAMAAVTMLSAVGTLLAMQRWTGGSDGAGAAVPQLAPGLSVAGTTNSATMRVLARQLAAAHRAAVRYPTLGKALRAGFTQAAPYAPGIGSHYMKYSLIYQPFNAAAPDMLLFDGDAPTSKLVGLAYYIYDSQGAPQGFAGPFDHWHQHRQTCVGPTGAHFEGDDDAIQCRGRGRNAWMLHLWVTPGYQSVNLIFSNFCTILD